MNIEEILELRQHIMEKLHQRKLLTNEINELSDQVSQAIDGLSNEDREQLTIAINGKYFS